MITYFFVVDVVPSKGSSQAEKTDYSIAHFWVVDNSAENAVKRVKHFLSEYMWDVIEWRTYAETTREQFSQMEDGLECYDRAQNEGLVSLFLGAAKGGRLQYDEIEIEPL